MHVHSFDQSNGDQGINTIGCLQFGWTPTSCPASHVKLPKSIDVLLYMYYLLKMKQLQRVISKVQGETHSVTLVVAKTWLRRHN